MIQYKKGDIVIVRVRNRPADEYPFNFVLNMTKFSQKPFVVADVQHYNNGIQKIWLCDAFGVIDVNERPNRVDDFVFSQPMLWPVMELI